MIELFKAECRRFRWLALGVGVFHLGLLLFFDRVMDPLQQSRAIIQAVALAYALVGALLGGFQFGSYARTNHWIALVHRPLAPYRILIAIAGAGASVLIATILLPLALLLLAHGNIGPRFVDSQNVLLILAALLFALIGYLSAAYVALAPRRFGWIIFFIAIIPATASAVGAKSILLQAVTVTAIALMLAAVFKPDLSLPPRKVLPLAATALLLSLGLNRALGLVGDFAFQVLWILAGTHPLNSIPPKGGAVEASRADGAALMAMGLANRHDRQAALWRDQIRMSEVFELPTARDWVTIRHQLTLDGPNAFEDKKRNVLWTFSHDSMAFRGVRQTDLRPAGMLRPAGGFPAPPMLAENNALLSGPNLYLFDEDDGAIHRRLTLPVGETLLAPPALVGDAVVLLGDKALHFYDRRDLEGDAPPHAPIGAVPLPGPVGNLERLHVIELLDGYLLSFTYGRDTAFGPTTAWQRMIVLDGEGHSRTVAERSIAQDFPAASRFARFWISPGLNVARTTLETTGIGDMPAWKHAPIRVPSGVWFAAGLLSLISAIAAAALSRRRRLDGREGALWTLATLLLGLPMLIAFWLIRPRPRS